MVSKVFWNSILFHISSRWQNHTVSHQYSSIFDFVSEIYSIKILIIDLAEFFCHSCIQCFLPWQTNTEQTHKLSLFLSVSPFPSFFLITIVRLLFHRFTLCFHCFSVEIKTWDYPTEGVTCLAKLHVCPEDDHNVKWVKIRVWSALSLESLGLIDKHYPRDPHATING